MAQTLGSLWGQGAGQMLEFLRVWSRCLGPYEEGGRHSDTWVPRGERGEHLDAWVPGEENRVGNSNAWLPWGRLGVGGLMDTWVPYPEPGAPGPFDFFPGWR